MIILKCVLSVSLFYYKLIVEYVVELILKGAFGGVCSLYVEPVLNFYAKIALGANVKNVFWGTI